MVLLSILRDFPGGSVVKKKIFAGQCRRHRRCRFDPWVGRSPGEGNGKSLQYSGLENPMDKRSLMGYSPWVARRLMVSELNNNNNNNKKDLETLLNLPPSRDQQSAEHPYFRILPPLFYYLLLGKKFLPA